MTDATPASIGDRRARMMFDRNAIARGLGLPPDLSVRSVFTVPDPMSIVVIVEGDSLDEVPYDCEAPYISSSLTTHKIDLGEVLDRLDGADTNPRYAMEVTEILRRAVEHGGRVWQTPPRIEF